MKKEQFLAMSLPSGIKVVCTDLIRFICEDVGIDTNRKLIEVLRGNYLPVLHPLSDLTNEITHNGETFVPVDLLLPEIGENYLHRDRFHDTIWLVENKARIDKRPIETLSFFKVLKLIEWHFNLMDESEPFIDVNTLETNPYA